MKYIEINNKDILTTPFPSFWCLCCYFLTCFIPCSSVSIVDFEHVKLGLSGESIDHKNFDIGA